MKITLNNTETLEINFLGNVTDEAKEHSEDNNHIKSIYGGEDNKVDNNF